ncbi:DUF383/DUF384 domain-containing protein [Protomyces lactucae-debilis]|uniref:Protein HGH1 homolog n=1 Tax=Protomyces lactucae-debilis TaxID=2754530 RepID=A0A1Y2FRX7_PROLT|nr:DUF383/DUF384 domain-containing protein [Protomyces lactucae-debilis]ORY86762.1 DUF383/DUF384 domain-containing protein [Protomyces lactucae-debilis]
MAPMDQKLLQELVGFLHDKNPQVRAVAAQELVPYSSNKNNLTHIFKANNFRAITDLRILVLDEPKTAHDSLTCLINLSQDLLIRAKLMDDLFFNQLLAIIVSKDHGLADLACMLLSNLAKGDQIKSLLTLKRKSLGDISQSTEAMNQLMDCFVQGAEKKLNPYANFDFLANLFSDLTRFEEVRLFFLQKQDYDDTVPLSKLVVFTEVESHVRRTGVASVIKNCCFAVKNHPQILDEAGINILPYILAPLCGPDEYSEEENEGMFDELQLLPEDKKRESDPFVVTIHLDTLLLLCSTREARDHLRKRQVYPIIRQLHLALPNEEEVSECCEKLANMLMRDEEDEESNTIPPQTLAALEEEDEEMLIQEL